MSFNIKLQDLLESGVHFGHQTGRWNPKMRPFIYGSRNGVHILNLAMTMAYAEDAYNQAVDVVSKGGSVLFVGTKAQARDVIKEAAQSCGQFFMVNRWLGGTLTNLRTMRKSIDKIKKLQEMEADGTFNLMTKKEALQATRERNKMLLDLEGILEMKRAPGLVFIVDIGHDKIAVDEANKLGVPVVGLCDTNSDPSRIDFPIPANDDAVRSIRTFAFLVAAGCKVGEAQRQQILRQEEEAAEAGESLVDTFIDADEEEELLTMRTVIKKVKKSEEPKPAGDASARVATEPAEPAATDEATKSAADKPADKPAASKPATADAKKAPAKGAKKISAKPAAKKA